MNWATLGEGCPAVFDRIIRLAATKDKSDRSFWQYDWMIRVHKYGQVCSQWKVAILSSRTLFKSNEECAIWWSNSYADDAKKLVDDGYMRVTKLFVVDDISLEHAELVCNVNDNKIQKFYFRRECLRTVHHKGDTHKWLDKMTRLLGTSQNAQIFTFDTTVYKKQQAVLLWNLLRAAIHCNVKPKEINYNVRSDIDISDWMFIRRAAPDNVGSIKLLNLGSRLFVPNFSKVAERIDTISLEYEVGCFYKVSEIKARCLRIEINVRLSDPWRQWLYWLREATSSFGFQVHSMQMVEFSVTLRALKQHEFSATFDNAFSQWQRMHEWLTNVEVREIAGKQSNISWLGTSNNNNV